MLQILCIILLFKGISAFTIEVTDHYCQQRSVSAEFQEFCNENNTCAFGKTALVSGYLNLTYAVSHSWGLASDSYIYMNTNLHLNAYNLKIQDMEPLLLCNDEYVTSGSDYDNDNTCPGAGIFEFTELPLQMPNVSSVVEWTSTGWTGQATVDMYTDEYGEYLIGRCILDVVTHSEGSSNSVSENLGIGVPKVLNGIFIYILGTLVLVAFGKYTWPRIRNVVDEDDDSVEFATRFRIDDSEDWDDTEKIPRHKAIAMYA